MPTIDEFHYAIGRRDLQVVETMLLQDKTLVNSFSSLGQPALQNPCWDGDIPMVELLLSQGADVNAVNTHNKNTPLHSAVSKGDLRLIKLLLEKGANVNAKAQHGITPLHVMAEFRFIDTDVADILLRWGADPWEKNAFGQSPLDVARKERGEGYMVKFLQAVMDGNDPFVRASYPKAGPKK